MPLLREGKSPSCEQMEKEYGNKLAMVYKDFPLPMHKDCGKSR